MVSYLWNYTSGIIREFDSKGARGQVQTLTVGPRMSDEINGELAFPYSCLASERAFPCSLKPRSGFFLIPQSLKPYSCLRERAKRVIPCFCLLEAGYSLFLILMSHVGAQPMHRPLPPCGHVWPRRRASATKGTDARI